MGTARCPFNPCEMRASRLFFLAFLLFAAGGSFAQSPSYYTELDEKLPQETNKEFQFLAFFYNHAVASNFYPQNDFLRGQIIGRLFGANTTVTSDSLRAGYFEQRILPFFIYAPKLFNGKAILRTSFEIDWTWGDVAYGSGGNSGSAPSGDQVNIQTQNVELELIPKAGWSVNLGLQRMYDTPHNPYRTWFETLLNTSYRLNYWGTDGVGISVRREADYYKWKAGHYQLYENNIQENDDVTLTDFSYRRAIGMRWHWGGSAAYVRDRANGEGGPSVLSQGLNSTLTDYNGAFRFRFANGAPYRADIFWVGSYFSYNEPQVLDRLFATGYVNYNFGSIRLNENDEWVSGPSLGGLGANLRLGYRYGQTIRDAVYGDFLYTSGDENGINDGRYSGVLTGNTWATPGGLYVSHGGYLLFPHANVVNRFVAAVTDISNQGYGISGLSVNASRDLVPNKLTAKVGLVSALANARPQGGGRQMGLEANGSLVYQLGVFMSIELHAAHLWLGDYYDSPLVNGNLAERPVNPSTAFLAFRWLMF